MSGARRECPYGLCDGSGMVVDLDANTTYRCRCWPEQVARKRARRLADRVPDRFANLSFEREPIPSITREAPEVVRVVRRYCDRVDEMLDRGEGLWFLGGPGTGKSHLAYLTAQTALAAGRSVAIYTGPRLMDALRSTYGAEESGATLDLIDRLTSVELLFVDDLAVARQTDWVLEQLYNIVNGRYENRRSIVFTCDLTAADDADGVPIDPRRLSRSILPRNYSRLIEMCGDPLILAGRDHRLDYRARAFEQTAAG